MDTLQSVLRALIDALTGNSNNTEAGRPPQRQFVATKPLRERDMIILDMLNSIGHEDVSFCVTDPDRDDCPIIFSSDGFCRFTGYDANEIEGQNCRFLQGESTLQSDVDKIRKAIREQKEASVNLLNYRKDGTSFNNEFFLAPLVDEHGKLQYFVGIQCSVKRLGPGQAPNNVGWVYAQGLHA
jgi:PAS domain S-box-containing protein